MGCKINAKVKVGHAYFRLLSCVKTFQTSAERFEQRFACLSLRMLGIVFASTETQVLYFYWLQMDCGAMDNSGSTSIAIIKATVLDIIKTAGNRIARGTELAVNFVLKRVGISSATEDEPRGINIEKRSLVIAACGRRVGYVKDLVNDTMLVDSPLGYTLTIPMVWIDRLDCHVRLDRNYAEIVGTLEQAP